MFYEYRRYQAQAGRRDELVKFMEETVIPFQVSKGMDVTGSFVDEKDPDIYIWIRRFENEAQREELYAKVYQSEVWKTEMAPKIDTLFIREKIAVTRIVPTPTSALQ
ncbi:NIPSNAP family containing protein (plasmid) [Deinococcus psychrotolerans]|uniref:NIPSNAP family containing protein n=1 Tax=Deinococcus psychrotolerans TaxID=2489213 RepID=A0A3G8YJR1_9DEIO|nr:NIPSNAP family protein [Deinococcus psychrotolerans]AZI44537.1 NIPSNAP family containing protein [Deinococcus psychrotolerans]